jgi:hypothetical protein
MSTLLALLNILSPLAFLLCALILHELTHVITIYPIAQDVQIVFDNGFDIHYQYENTPFNQTYATLSNLSPSIIGITILLVLSISTTHSYPPLLVSGNLNYLTVGLYLGTIIYSVGGKNDYQLITCDTSP